MEPTNDDKRIAIADAVKDMAWQKAVAAGLPIEDIVVLVADENDSNARVLLKQLGEVPPSDGEPGEMSITLLVLRRSDVIRNVEPHDPNLADKLRTPTPMKITTLVVALGGWSTLGLGRNVGQA